MQTDTFVNLTNDILFKYVFSHKEVVSDLLASFFDYIGIPKKIVKIEVFKDYPIYGKKLEDKRFFGDIVAILDTGEFVSIEMYTNEFGKEEYMKSASYLSRLFGNQLKKGDTYKNAKKVYSINFIFGNYANENREVVNDYGFIRKVSNPNLNNEFINLYLVRLDLVSKMVYNKSDKKLIRWGKLMISENMRQMKQIGKDDEAMEQSIAYVQEFLKENGTTWQDKLTYEKNKGRDEGLVEGHAEGLIEGRAEGLIEAARNMLNDNMDIKEISKYTGLSKIEIEVLK